MPKDSELGILFDIQKRQRAYKCKGLVRLLALVFDGAVSDAIFRWTSRITSEELLLFMEACRLKSVKIHVAGNVGLDYLEVLKKNTEQRVKRNVIGTEHQHAIDALKNDMQPSQKDFHEDIQLIRRMYMERTHYQKTKNMAGRCQR